MPIHIPVHDLDVRQLVAVAVICTHPDAYIEKACCPPSSLVECGCGGRDAVVCPNPNCQGIEDHEVDNLIDRIAGDRVEDC